MGEDNLSYYVDEDKWVEDTMYDEGYEFISHYDGRYEEYDGIIFIRED